MRKACPRLVKLVNACRASHVTLVAVRVLAERCGPPLCANDMSYLPFSNTTPFIYIRLSSTHSSFEIWLCSGHFGLPMLSAETTKLFEKIGQVKVHLPGSENYLV